MTIEGDLTPLAPLGQGRLRSGPVRSHRPVYVDLLPPCNAGCPAGENIQAWLALIKAGDAEAAWRQLTADNPLPAIHGRVCYHPCETACNRVLLDAAVSIHGVERYLGDQAIEHRLAVPGSACEDRTAGARRRLRAERPVGGLPPRQNGPRGGGPRQRPVTGRDDALRNPVIPAASRRARC